MLRKKKPSSMGPDKFTWTDRPAFDQDLLHDDLTLMRIKAIMENRFKSGEMFECYACSRVIKAYPRRINEQMARSLVLMCKRPHTSAELIKLTCKRGGGGDHHKLCDFGLAAKVVVEGEDDRLRITEKGRAFLKGEIEIAKFILMFRNESWGHSHETVMIGDCDGEFDLEELLNQDTIS